MRIISGSLGGLRFTPPKGKFDTRPTTDLAREALFNILDHQYSLKSSRFLDLFGGWGGITFEAVSRGCKDSTVVDRHASCIRFIKDTAERFKVEEYIHFVQSDVEQFLKYEMTPFDIIFADPPYRWPRLPVLPKWIFDNGLLSPGGVLVVEHDAHTYLEHYPEFTHSKKYGHTVFSFFKCPV